MNSDTEEFSPEVLHKNPLNLGKQLAASACLSCLHLSAVGNAVLDHSFCLCCYVRILDAMWYSNLSQADPYLSPLLISGLWTLKVLTLLTFVHLKQVFHSLSHWIVSSKDSLGENGALQFQGQCYMQKTITQSIWFLTVTWLLGLWASNWFCRFHFG